MVWTVAVLVGLTVGFVLGRWWALVSAVGFGAWVAWTTGVDEVPPWFLGLAYGTFVAVGVAAGVLVRRRVRS